MTIELTIPEAGESIEEAQVGAWKKSEGDRVAEFEPVVELDTDKASIELPSPASGVLKKIVKKSGEMVRVGDVIALIDNDDPPTERGQGRPTSVGQGRSTEDGATKALASAVKPTESANRASVGEAEQKPSLSEREIHKFRQTGLADRRNSRRENPVRMSLPRRQITERLVAARRAAAYVTSYSEIDMSGIERFSRQFGESAAESPGMAFSPLPLVVSATLAALRALPRLNAEVRGSDVVFRNYCDLGVVMYSGRSQATPVLRDADAMSFRQIVCALHDALTRAEEELLSVDELGGATFTIVDNGPFESLISTPLVDPPQTAVLGLHTITERPVSRSGDMVVRPMMYISLTYDRRVAEEPEAAEFLRRIKLDLETPSRLLLDA